MYIVFLYRKHKYIILQEKVKHPIITILLALLVFFFSFSVY